MDDDVFEGLVDKAVDEIPEEFKDKMENVSILTQDWPSGYQEDKLGGGSQSDSNVNQRRQRRLIFGLYEGIPQTRRGSYGVGGALPDKITIFKIPILMISRTYEDVVRNVLDTVIHEVGHHFGMNEEDIHKAKNRSVKEKKAR